MGIILPKVRVRDNMRLPTKPISNQNRRHGRGPGHDRRGARTSPAGTIAAHLSETVRQHADELLTRDAVKHLIDELRQTSPAVVDELIPGVMKLGEVQQVLQMLLREAVPIRQLGPILETLGDYAPRTKDPLLLAEHVRRRLARAICTRYRDQERRLRVVTLDPALEEQIRAAIEHNEDGLAVRLSPHDIEGICQRIAAATDEFLSSGHPAIVLVSADIRPALKRLTAGHKPQLVVLSYNEITRDTKIESVAMVAAEESEELSAVSYQKSA